MQLDDVECGQQRGIACGRGPDVIATRQLVDVAQLERADQARQLVMQLFAESPPRSLQLGPGSLLLSGTDLPDPSHLQSGQHRECDDESADEQQWPEPRAFHAIPASLHRPSRPEWRPRLLFTSFTNSL